jgi:hypothetical protein
VNDRANDDEVRKAKARRPWGHVLLQITLAGMPELSLFESDEQRKAALSEIGKEAGNPVTASYWLSVGMVVISVWLIGWGVELLWTRLQLGLVPLWLVRLVVMAAAFALVLTWVHRRGAAGELRTKLLQFGVPVCMKCGYSLRGLSLAIGRCPECGAGFDERVREILADADAKMRDER